MSMLDKSEEVTKYIHILEQADQSLKALKAMLPSTYTHSLSRLESHIKILIEKAGELSAFLSSLEEIRKDVCLNERCMKMAKLKYFLKLKCRKS